MGRYYHLLILLSLAYLIIVPKLVIILYNRLFHCFVARFVKIN
jgi:hypothetical protein